MTRQKLESRLAYARRVTDLRVFRRSLREIIGAACFAALAAFLGPGESQRGYLFDLVVLFVATVVVVPVLEFAYNWALARHCQFVDCYAEKGALVQQVADLRTELDRVDLVVDAFPRAPYVVATHGSLPGMDALETLTKAAMLYYRIAVTNRSRHQQVSRCRVQLVGVRHATGLGWSNREGWEPLDLVWSHRPGQTEADLAGSETLYCDVGRVLSNYLQSNAVPLGQLRPLYVHGADTSGRPALFLFEAKTLPNSQPTALAAGYYLLRLHVYATGIPTVAVDLALDHTGSFASQLPAPPDGTVFEIRPVTP